MKRPDQPRPHSLNRQLFGTLMEKAVPLDHTGDERISELLGQLRDERDRRAKKEARRDARHH